MDRLIPLTRGKFAIVDESDFAELSRHKWYAFRGKDTIYYAARKAGLPDSDYNYREVIFMHKQLLNSRSLVDHKDRDGLNNRRENLRQATYGQNNANRVSRIGSSSQYLGVRWRPDRKVWTARCRGVSLGTFATEEGAAKAYDQYAIKEYGEFANLNFPLEIGGYHR